MGRVLSLPSKESNPWAAGPPQGLFEGLVLWTAQRPLALKPFLLVLPAQIVPRKLHSNSVHYCDMSRMICRDGR